MLIALDARTGAHISVYTYKALATQDRPLTLRCPGESVEGLPCLAPVTACALKSDHVHPYFRVGRVNDHVEGCSEGVEDLPVVDGDTDLVGVKGLQGARGPQHVVRVRFRTPPGDGASSGPTTVGIPREGHHRAAAPGGSNKPFEARCGLRKIALDHERGVITDNTTIVIRSLKAPASEVIYPAVRLINAPYQGHDIIAYGRIASISEGEKKGTYFIRMRLPKGNRTKVSVMINTKQSAQIGTVLGRVLKDPTAWMIVACGTIQGRRTQYRHLDPHDIYSVEFQRSSTASTLSTAP